jgi:hypothetical protein
MTACRHFDHDLCRYSDPRHCNHKDPNTGRSIVCPRMKELKKK